MKKTTIIIVLCFFPVIAFAQFSNGFQLFRGQIKDTINKNHLGALAMIQNGKIDYLSPLSHWSKVLASQRNDSVPDGVYDNLSQTLSFLGDYKSVLFCLETANLTRQANIELMLDNRIESFAGAKLAIAKDIIRQYARTREIVMLNEAHCKPLHRAFVYDMLDEFYTLGFRYLAMETLTNGPSININAVSSSTGYYTCEPIGGELVRKALRIGFTLYAYEDTARNSSGPQRDSAQAAHLYELLKSQPKARILVLAGYGHIEKTRASQDFIPMAYQFKKISQIDPLCIDQTLMTEQGDNYFSATFYNKLIKKYPTKVPAVLVKNQEPVELLPDHGKYDLRIIHPESVFIDGRATWYSLSDEKILKTFPKKKSDYFLAQAYLPNEVHERSLNQCIPVDQSFTGATKSSNSLYLRTGSYLIIWRNPKYQVVDSSRINIISK